MVKKGYCLYFLRWNNLKMKVAQAKQRLGPRIQSEAKSVTVVSNLASTYDCVLPTAYHFSPSLTYIVHILLVFFNFIL